MSDATHPTTGGGTGVHPGWYPDPRDGSVERWWDGTAWTDATRPVSVLTRPLAAPVLTNTPATVGLVLGAFAMLVNSFLLASLAGVVLSFIGLRRAGQLSDAGYAPVGRRRALAGLVLWLLGGAGTVLFKGLLF